MDFDEAEKLKGEANTLFREQKYDEACTKYFGAINAIRLNQDLAKSQVGINTMTACRNNLAMCKLKQKDYDSVIDQCERVLEHDPKNTKAVFRMSQAAFALSQGVSVSQLKVALKYAT